MSKKLSRELIAQKVKSDRIESIRNLNLWGSNIEDISILEEMPSLEIVSLSVNKIRTLRPFSNLSKLRELYLRRNLIANLNEIKYLIHCENLSVLWLSENPICNNPNYRAVVICILPQLQKLDDIAITDEERDKAEKRLSGNFEEDDEENSLEEDNNKNIQQHNEEEEKYSSNKKEKILKDNNNSKKAYGYNGNEDYEIEDRNHYGNNSRKNQDQKNKYLNNKYDNEDEEYIKPKKTYQQRRQNNNNDDEKYNKEVYNYDDMPIRAKSGIISKNENYSKNNVNKFDDDTFENNNSVKKKGNSNILNCVISLLKELSPNELKMVKREIDRLNS